MATNFDMSWWSKTPTELNKFLDVYKSTIEIQGSLGKGVVTFSFYDNAHQPSAGEYAYIPPGETPKFIEFTEVQKNDFRALTQYLSSVIDVRFQEVGAGQGDIRLGAANSFVNYSEYPSNSYSSIIISEYTASLTQGFIRSVAHEFGHSLGLKHPANYSGFEPAPYLKNDLDTVFLTNMSYNDISGVAKTSFGSNLGYSPLDLAALLNKYGASKNNDGVTYKFIEKTDLFQSFKDGIYTVAMPTDGIFWVPNTKGFDTIDVTQWGDDRANGADAFSNHSFVDGNLGAVSIKNGSNKQMVVEDFYSHESIITPINHANIRIYGLSDELGNSIESLILTDASDTVYIGNVFEKISSNDGCDFFLGFGNKVTINGGGGDDVWTATGYTAKSASSNELVFVDHIGTSSFEKQSHSIKSFELTQTKEGLNIKNSVTGDQMLFIGIEALQFNDAKILIDTNLTINHLQAYRLYKAAFDRAPDLGGLGYWINSLDNGNTLVNVASGFVSSPEFQGLYGVGSSDQTFVRKLYNNVLDRDPDQGGYDFWLGHMANGMSRQDVLINFSESNENKNNVAEIVAHGVAYQEWIG